MKQITINLDPAYVIIGNGMHPCNTEKIRELLRTLGCDNWPMRECVIKLVLTESDPRWDQLNTLFSSEPERTATAA